MSLQLSEKRHLKIVNYINISLLIINYINNTTHYSDKMSGRGKLFSNDSKLQDIADSGQSSRDSGVNSQSPASSGEYRRIGRGQIINELVLSFPNKTVNISRGRARVFEAMENISLFGSEKTDKTDPLIVEEPNNSKNGPKLIKGIDISNKCSKKINDADHVSNSMNNLMVTPLLKHGCKGSEIKLACNFIRLSTDPHHGVYVYEVCFSPNIDSVRLRMKYLNEHCEKIGKTKTFDGSTLYLPIFLENKLTTLVSKDLSNGLEIEIRILFKRKESIGKCIHLLNVLFDRVMKTLNYVRFDRKQFDPSAPKIIPQHKLEVWPGYVITVDELESGLMLCCDVSHRLLCQKTVLETLIEIYQRHPNNFQENSKKYFLGSIVITRYNNRTYRIDDILFDKNPLSTFKYKNTVLSYIEYYRLNHNIEIKDKNQPLLISLKKQRGSNVNQTEDFIFCLIPEACYLTGLRDEMRSDFKLMREVATFTRVSPHQRICALEKFYENVNNNKEAKEILYNWGLTLNKPCEYIKGRQFDEENIYFAKKSVTAGICGEFSKYAISNDLLEVVNLRNWILMYNSNDSRIAKSFIEIMDRNTHTFGVSYQKPEIKILDNDRIETYIFELRKCIKPGLQCIVLICPTMRDDRYAAIKKVCCAELPIPSQVINARTLSNENKNRSIIQKIALQINCKLGGALWRVKIPLKNVMICGIDSYHEANQKGNSVSAFVASLNASYTKWYSKAVIQTKGEEILKGLCSSFLSALIAYEKENGNLPDSVIIYRDGVGEGQLQLCANFELPQMYVACQNGFPKHSLKITYIVVQKRISSRFFAVNGSKIDNPLPGTIVDTSITQQYKFDFFLVSQSVRQGTVSPTHYIVIRDDVKYNADILQRLSYKLCFLYYNWPGTIRIPACCQYAHKMAYLIGQSIKRTTSEKLATKLFYL